MGNESIVYINYDRKILTIHENIHIASRFQFINQKLKGIKISIRQQYLVNRCNYTNLK